MKTHRWVILIAAVILIVGILVGAFWDTYWARMVRRVSTIAVRNGCSSSLHDVRISAACSRGPFVRTAERLGPGKMLKLAVRTSDLWLEKVTWTLSGEAGTYDGGGIATPGEVFVVEIRSAGGARTYYAR